MSDKANVFKHISAKVGEVIPDNEFSIFVSGVALSLLDEAFPDIKGSFRLVKSNTPCVFSSSKLFLVPYEMFPKNARATKAEMEEAINLAQALSVELVEYPLSFACLSGDGSTPLSGSDYLVKVEKDTDKS